MARLLSFFCDIRPVGSPQYSSRRGCCMWRMEREAKHSRGRVAGEKVGEPLRCLVHCGHFTNSDPLTQHASWDRG